MQYTMRELEIVAHAAVSLLGAHSGACSVDTTSRLRRQALVVHGSTGNDAPPMAGPLFAGGGAQ